VALAFGLIHRLGFTGALRDVGLPSREFPLALFVFNCGNEFGQLMFHRRRARRTLVLGRS